jgi:hypothetical protein
MKVIHEFQITGICPVGGSVDRYEVAVKTRCVVTVESIKEAAKSLPRDAAAIFAMLGAAPAIAA